jgi:DNA polymerase-4
MDAFFASVELARRPELRDRPLIVGGEGRSVVLAASYPARAFGVRSAMPMSLARRLCPQAVVVPPDHRRYHEVSAAVMEILGEVTPLVEQVSVDEAFLDVSGAWRRLGSPTQIADLIRRRVSTEQGVTCSVGIAATKFVAKLASGFAKPDGVILVPADTTVAFLHGLEVGALWGVGDRTREALARWGITTVAQLAESDVRTVQRAVGSVVGSHLHDLAWGRDPRPVVPERQEKSIGAETTFEADTRDLGVVGDHLLALADKCSASLRARGLVGRTVVLKVRNADFETVTRSRTLTVPTDLGSEVFRTARELLDTVALGGAAVRLIGVRVEGLSRAEARQLTLEEATAGDTVARRRAEGVMDEVRDRFGVGAVLPGAVVPRRAQLPPTAPGIYPDVNR